MTDLFYKAFEDKHRGSRELIKSRLEAYLPFIRPLLKFYPHGDLIDLGCGRGEWLELTAENGFNPQGVDIDEGMLKNARDLGLVVQKIDALTFLKQLPDKSQTVVSGFHVAEHIPFKKLQQLVQEAKRVLVPGGLLILETPNPENLIVGTSSFYLDPTHLRPIPPELLYFLPEHYGYARQKIIRLQEPLHLTKSPSASLLDVIEGVSPDYSVIAQTEALPKVLKVFNASFNQDYGLTLHALAEKFQHKVTSQQDQCLILLQQLHAQQQQTQARLELIQSLVLDQERQAKDQLQQALEVSQASQAQVLLAQKQVVSLIAEIDTLRKELQASHQYNHNQCKLAEQRQAHINALRNSTSWRITAPLRWLGSGLRILQLKPIKPKIKVLIKLGSLYVLRRPKLKRFVKAILSRLPSLKNRLMRLQNVETIGSGLMPQEVNIIMAGVDVKDEYGSTTQITSQDDTNLKFCVLENELINAISKYQQRTGIHE